MQESRSRRVGELNLSGVLFFPVTPFNDHGKLDTGLLRAHIESRLHPEVAALFAGCGTGEFHALNADEVALVANEAAGAAGGVPLVVGAGGQIGHAWSCARAAADAGAEALLVLPPYLAAADEHGLLAYIESVATATDVPVIVYHRPSAVLTAEMARRLMECDNVIGIKDGLGDLSFMRDALASRDASGRSDVALLNGLPLAELHEPAYRSAGIPIYSSSTYVMAPRIALAYRAAAQAGDDDRCQNLLNEFYRPIDELRQRRPGYNIALVKAGVRLGGLAVGSVRPPLVELAPSELEELRRLLDHGHQVAGE